jgi:hypothetical protein
LCDFGTEPYSCEVGDLSGKFGKITSGEAAATYTSAFMPGLNNIVDRSIVLHCNGQRAICAKLVIGAEAALETEYALQNITIGSAAGPTFPPVNCSAPGVTCVINGSASLVPGLAALCGLLMLFLR